MKEMQENMVDEKGVDRYLKNDVEKREKGRRSFSPKATVNCLQRAKGTRSAET